MTETADVVIVGGGILGASTAYYLAKLGFGKVVLLEKQTLAAGSTGKSAAVVRSFYSNEVCVKLARRAVDVFEKFNEELGEDIGFNRIGYMVITHDATTVDHVLELHRRNGIGSSKLAPDEINKLLPHMNLEGVVAAGYEPDSGYADPFLTVAAMVQKARQMGLKTFQKREVVKINAKNGRIESVDTTRGPISTKIVLNAGGPWATKFHPFPDIPLPLRLSREQDCVFEAPKEFHNQPVVSDSILGVYSRSDVGGRLLAGAGYPKEEEPCDPDHVDERSDAGFGDALHKKLLKRFPTLKDAPIVHGWAGMYTITPDWHPIVGKSPGTEGYYLAVGGSGHSFKIGPPIGESLAAMIAGRVPPIDISALRYERFKENQTFRSVWGPGNRA
jgi:sarcosine oxidase subunit beta